MNEEDKTRWFATKEVPKINAATCFRCPGIENFVNKIEESKKIVGVEFDGNDICFMLADK